MLNIAIITTNTRKCRRRCYTPLHLNAQLSFFGALVYLNSLFFNFYFFYYPITRARVPTNAHAHRITLYSMTTKHTNASQLIRRQLLFTYIYTLYGLFRYTFCAYCDGGGCLILYNIRNICTLIMNTGCFFRPVRPLFSTVEFGFQRWSDRVQTMFSTILSRQATP